MIRMTDDVSVYRECSLTVEADDLIAVCLSWRWIPQQFYRRISHRTLSHIARRGQAYN